MAAKLGDFYPHETLISHVRRLLATKFAKDSLHETPNQFATRMKRVEEYLNYEMKDGDSLERLGKSFAHQGWKAEKLEGRENSQVTGYSHFHDTCNARNIHDTC